MLKGLDISHYQGQPDFDTLKKSFDFVIIKATEGTTFIDPQFQRNRDEARRVGLLLGFYHFANVKDAIVEADHFLDIVKPLPGELLCLDFEVSHPNPPAWCSVFMGEIKSKLNTNCLVYLNKSQLKSFDWSNVIASNYGLWLASYDGETSIPSNPWTTVAMKQWSSSGSDTGIAGNIDIDTFFGDQDTFKKYGFQGVVMPQNDDLTKILTHYSVKSADELISMVDTQLQYLSECRTQLTKSKGDYDKLSQDVNNQVSSAVAKADAESEALCQVRIKQAAEASKPIVPYAQVQNVEQTGVEVPLPSIFAQLLNFILRRK